MVVSALKEINSEEHRVSLTPLAANTLLKRGINVKVEKGAGLLASISDEEFTKIGAKVVDKQEAVSADILLKVRCPEASEVSSFRSHSTLISFIFPENNKEGTARNVAGQNVAAEMSRPKCRRPKC
uniref:proton-translocating NAD(P)(+) transhydrogenase n=1 Tax=Meloidogyne javanica TaxID=6303 RepID=A0A915N5S2_MELJA